MDDTKEIAIKSEEDAYQLLELLLADQSDLMDEKLSFSFDGWPHINIRLQGDEYSSSITPTIMKAFIDLQANIYRSYALTKYNSPNVRLLTNDERKELEIIVKVGDGSSIFKVDLQGVLEKLATEMAGKLDAKQITITILGIALVWGGTTSYKHYLDSRVKIRQEEVKSEEQRDLIKELHFSQEQETKRTNMILQLVQNNSSVANVSALADDARAEMLKRSVDAKTMSIQGVEVTGKVASELTKNARRKAEEVRLDGSYRILSVDSTDPNEFRVKLKCLSSGAEFNAKVQDGSMEQRYIDALRDGEWNRLPVQLKINAKSLDGSIKDALVIQASPSKITES